MRQSWKEPLFSPANKKELSTMDAFLDAIVQAPDFIYRIQTDANHVLNLLRSDGAPISDVRRSLSILEEMLKNKTSETECLGLRDYQ